MFVITDDLFGTPPVAARQTGAMQGNVIQFIGKSDSTPGFLHLGQSFSDGLFNGLGQRFSGQACEPFRQGVRVSVFDVQWHR